MDKLKLAEQTLVKDGIPDFRPGDRVNIHYRVREGEKERIQQFEGDVISRQGSGANKTFMVRKISVGNIGVERIFPLNSPFIAKIEVKKEGDVDRSKLYYLRDRSGKSARIKEKDTRETESEEQIPEKAARKESVKDEAKSDDKRTTVEEEEVDTASNETKDKNEAADQTEAETTAERKADSDEDDTSGQDEEESEKKKQSVSEEE